MIPTPWHVRVETLQIKYTKGDERTLLKLLPYMENVKNFAVTNSVLTLT